MTNPINVFIITVFRVLQLTVGCLVLLFMSLMLELFGRPPVTLITVRAIISHSSIKMRTRMMYCEDLHHTPLRLT